MQSKHNSFKTLGAQAAHFVVTLYEKGRQHFTLEDVVSITGLEPASARSFARKLVDRAVATRLHAGLFTLVPFELGAEREYMGNPYVVARELVGGSPYYLSHASAMDLHAMVTQPQLVVFVSTPRQLRPCTIMGTEFRFVHIRSNAMFGTTKLWLDRHEAVLVSDVERTIIDGLRHPQYCGGLSEVAKGLWLRRDQLRPAQLVKYALKLGVGAVIRRLGFLLELYGVGTSRELGRLHAKLTATYALLDPMLSAEGKHLARWRLQLNVTPEELQNVVAT